MQTAKEAEYRSNSREVKNVITAQKWLQEVFFISQILVHLPAGVNCLHHISS